MKDRKEYDKNTGFALKVIPPGFNYSARIGDTTRLAHRQSLSYKIAVDTYNTLLIVRFAVVFEAPHKGHKKEEEPRFMITFYDEDKNLIQSCGNYDVYSSDSRIQGFQKFAPEYSSDTIYWRNWTAVGLDLTPFKGKTITIEFMSADCSRTGHYGYAYIVAECLPMQIDVGYCGKDKFATLFAPEGFSQYDWYDPKGNNVGSEPDLPIREPQEGDKYRCELTSATGCKASLEGVIKRYNPKASFTKTVDCATNTVSFHNFSTTDNGDLFYIWNFGDKTTSNEKNPVHTYTTAGLKRIRLLVRNFPSTCVDSLIDTIYSFNSKTVKIKGDSLLCPNKGSVLTASGGYTYKWSTGDTTTSIIVNNTGRYWLIGYSRDLSCKSDTIYCNVKNRPDWDFSVIQQDDFCEGSSTFLKAVSNDIYIKYEWSTGEFAPSTKITKPGTYYVKGINRGECIEEKTKSITVIEHPKPLIDFNFSRGILNTNSISVSANVNPSEQNTNYLWDMGDGTQLTGSTINHQYPIEYAYAKNWQFPVRLTATSQYGCVNDTTRLVDISLFIPNVFTPNGDGVNDIFMSDVELTVYDRNGIKIYQGTEGWDGSYKGKKAENDTYFYLINIIGLKNKKTYKGYVMLKR